MWTLAGRAEHEEDIKKSRFLALAEPIQAADQAAAFLAANRRPDATHHCWAWRLGAAYRFNDDGEPGGTARSEEHTSELQSLMRISYADFCLKKKHEAPEQNE